MVMRNDSERHWLNVFNRRIQECVVLIMQENVRVPKGKAHLKKGDVETTMNQVWRIDFQHTNNAPT
jgi:hypothetical protein